MPILGAQDLKQAGADACVFLPDFGHLHVCQEWIEALEASSIDTALVAGFLGILLSSGMRCLVLSCIPVCIPVIFPFVSCFLIGSRRLVMCKHVQTQVVGQA